VPQAMTIVLVAVLAAGCARETGGDARRFPLTGTVAGREVSPPRTLVTHEAIDGLMPAMTMGFEIVGAMPPMRNGDRIAGTLVVTAERSWLESVRVTARAEGGGSAEREVVASAAVPGVLVPPFDLRDQDGAPLTLRQFRGRVLVVTFIYTRCPLPQFCPLMVSHLETVRRGIHEVGHADRARFLGVTLDPTFDTPPVLRAYGEGMLHDEPRFSAWSLATGTEAAVQEIAGFFGVDYRADGSTIVHGLATAVVGADGRVIRVWPSNSWTPSDVLDVVRRETGRIVEN
jgi:protein SCO1/2